MTPAVQEPTLASEVILEQNDYLPPPSGEWIFGVPSYKFALATYSKYPGREYAYQNLGMNTAQYDLHQPGGACVPPFNSCPDGYACRPADNTCYVGYINTVKVDTRQNTGRIFSNGGGQHGAGTGSYGRSYQPTNASVNAGAPKTFTDPRGLKTSYGFNSVGRIRCIVHDDDDDEAFAEPSQPDTSTCAGPASAQVVRFDYTANTITRTTASVLSGDVEEITTLDTATLLPISTSIEGQTRNINGTPISQTQTTSYLYSDGPDTDPLGRPVVVDGPLDPAVALDKTKTTYYTSFDSGWPYNLGQIKETKRYVGTSSSNYTLVTQYQEYDLFGVPHKIIYPNLDFVTLTASSDRLVWAITHRDWFGAALRTSTLVLNADGTVRSSTDGDGVCLTYEYADQVPIKIKRSGASGCGTVPIDDATGEVEVRTYHYGEPERLASITRKTNNVTEFSYSFASTDYDIDRRLKSASTLNSSSAFELVYTDTLPTSVVAPEAPGPGTWRTDKMADALARTTSVSRFIDASNKQTYTYSYASPMSPRPTQLSRGFNGSTTSVTTYIYDDFGRLIETVVPEAGQPGGPKPTRYEYDVADRMVKKRVAEWTGYVRTSAYSHDSLGRTTYVDHDTEHPVNCSTAPAGTPIQDEEYVYDGCSEVPPGWVLCTNARGRLAISRAVIQCSATQSVVKRGRWYAYTQTGEVAKVGYATVTGSSIGTPATTYHTYTAGGRLLQYDSPLNSAFGTKYTIPTGTTDGRVTTVTTSLSAPIASNLAYRAFGPLKWFTTAVVQPSGGSTRTLVADTAYRSDNSILGQNWTLVWSSGPLVFNINIMAATMGYSPAGLPTTRMDTADIPNSRLYQYDALLRMTCEARGDTVQPSSGDCNTSSARLAGLFTYGNGQSTTSPPDVRLTSFIKSPNPAGSACSATNRCYVSPSSESSTYTNGSGQLQGITRTGSSLVIGHNSSLGTRTYEYDSFDATRSRRDYTYLPNGQLGTISGRTPTNVPYTYTMRYDERGRPLTITGSDTYELFWDDADRLIAAQITLAAPRGRLWDGFEWIGIESIRWHYHYLGSTLVAATRELVYQYGYTTQVKRFWAVTDERGIVYRLFDEVGATHWQARWDATGWRAYVGTPQPETWMPFGLPGQVVLGATRVYKPTPLIGTVWQDATEAFASGTGGTWTRPPIALNRWRAYDPVLGTFLQPDNLDQTGRLDPEGYVLARSSPLLFTDPTGAESDLLDVLLFGAGAFFLPKDVKRAARRAVGGIPLAGCGRGGGGGPPPPPGSQGHLEKMCGFPFYCEPKGSLSHRCARWRCEAFFCAIGTVDGNEVSKITVDPMIMTQVLKHGQCSSEALSTSNGAMTLLGTHGCEGYLAGATCNAWIPPRSWGTAPPGVGVPWPW